jgi:hypothetical protein
MEWHSPPGLPAETDTNQTADPESDGGGAEKQPEEIKKRRARETQA